MPHPEPCSFKEAFEKALFNNAVRYFDNAIVLDCFDPYMIYLTYFAFTNERSVYNFYCEGAD